MATPGSVVSSGALMTPGGDQGSPAYTVTTANFTVPAVGATVTVPMNDTTWMTVGEMVWIATANGATAGVMQIQSISGNQVTLLNLGTSPGTGGDMLKAVYDVNNDGIIDHAAWAGLSGVPATFPPSPYYGADTTNTNAYVITVTSDFQLNIGAVVYFTITNGNTGPATLAVNTTGAKPLVNRSNIQVGSLAGSQSVNTGRTYGAVYDGTSWRIFTFLPLSYWNGAAQNNLTIECAGYDSIILALQYNSGATGAGITLAHVPYGVHIFIDILNNTGAAMNYFVNGTGPTGAAFNGTYWIWTNAIAGATAVRMDSTSMGSMSSGNRFMAFGGAMETYLFFK